MIAWAVRPDNHMTMKCPKCNSETVETVVEGRNRHSCQSCGFMQYDSRGTTSGYYEMVDDIADSVAAHGEHQEMAVALANTCFRTSADKTFQHRIAEWCNLHGFAFSSVERSDAHGKCQQYIRFARSR
jgi:hypothetical protein